MIISPLLTNSLVLSHHISQIHMLDSFKKLSAIHGNIFGKVLLITIQRIHEVDGNAKDAVVIMLSIDIRRTIVNNS